MKKMPCFTLKNLGFVTVCNADVGEGLRQKNRNDEECDKGTEHNSCLSNMWFCGKNENKLCVEGCIVNLLFHLKEKEEANEFKRIPTFLVKI